MGIPHKGNPQETGKLGGKVSRGSDEAHRLGERLARYARAHGRSLKMLHHIREQIELCSDPFRSEQLSRILLNLQDCGHWLRFHHYFTVGKVRLSGASFCRQHLICPLCAIRRGSKALKAYLDRYQVIMAENPGLSVSFVTLTVKNGPVLLERFDHLRKGVQRLHQRRRDYIRKGYGSGEFNKVLGAVGSYEFTNKGKGWHPHVHLIVLHSEPIDGVALSREWHQVTGDSFIVDVRSFGSGDPADHFVEVFKYAVKFSDLSLSDNLAAALDLKGKRLMFSFGLFHGVQVPESLTDELLDDLPYIELFYSYLHGAGYTLKSPDNRRSTGQGCPVGRMEAPPNRF